MIRNELSATVEFQTLAIDDRLRIEPSGVVFRKSSQNGATYRGGVYLFGLVKPVYFVPRGTTQEETT